MNLPNTLTLVRIFLVPLLVVVLLTQCAQRRMFGVPKELIGAAIFRHRVDHRLARRLPGAAPPAGHVARAGARSDR
jgi:phosphatidylglycerophosphate synthase